MRLLMECSTVEKDTLYKGIKRYRNGHDEAEKVEKTTEKAPETNSNYKFVPFRRGKSNLLAKPKYNL